MPEPRDDADRTAVVVPALVGLGTIAFSPAFYHPFFTLRAALLLVLVGPGIAMLAVQARRDVPARAALGFLLVAALATAASPDPEASLWGPANSGTGFLFIAACVGMWALARLASPLAITRTRAALGAGIAANVGIAVLQRAGSVPEILEVVDRPFGLTGNAVHLGALCAASILVVPGERDRLRVWEAGLIAIAGAGVQLSGGRSALALVAIAVALCAWRFQSPRTAALIALVVALGVVTASFVPGDAPTATSRSAAGESSGSFTPRIGAWRGGVTALQDRPLLGYGPGRFLAAATPYRTAAMARIDGDALFIDAHNIVLELAVGVGLLGLVALVVWLALLMKKAAGRWFAFAAVLAVAQMVEPMSVIITPLMALGLGIGSPLSPTPGSRRPSSLLLAATALPGLALAASLVIGELQLQRASLDFSRSALASADRLLPGSWPTVPLVGTRVEGFYGASDPAARQRAIAHAREATERVPEDPRTWTRLGSLEGVWGSRDSAAEAFRAALRRNPWSAGALRGLAKTAEDSGDEDLAAATCRTLRRISAVGQCADRPLREW